MRGGKKAKVKKMMGGNKSKVKKTTMMRGGKKAKVQKKGAGKKAEMRKMKGGGMKTEMFQDYVKRMFGGGKTK